MRSFALPPAALDARSCHRQLTSFYAAAGIEQVLRAAAGSFPFVAAVARRLRSPSRCGRYRPRPCAAAGIDRTASKRLHISFSFARCPSVRSELRLKFHCAYHTSIDSSYCQHRLALESGRSHQAAPLPDALEAAIRLQKGHASKPGRRTHRPRGRATRLRIVKDTCGEDFRILDVTAHCLRQSGLRVHRSSPVITTTRMPVPRASSTACFSPLRSGSLDVARPRSCRSQPCT